MTHIKPRGLFLILFFLDVTQNVQLWTFHLLNQIRFNSGAVTKGLLNISMFKICKIFIRKEPSLSYPKLLFFFLNVLPLISWANHSNSQYIFDFYAPSPIIFFQLSLQSHWISLWSPLFQSYNSSFICGWQKINLALSLTSLCYNPVSFLFWLQLLFNNHPWRNRFQVFVLDEQSRIVFSIRKGLFRQSAQRLAAM